MDSGIDQADMRAMRRQNAASDDHLADMAALDLFHRLTVHFNIANEVHCPVIALGHKTQDAFPNKPRAIHSDGHLAIGRQTAGNSPYSLDSSHDFPLFG
ncbi:MAG: hypothetical protein PHO91_04410 [Patescibacteria group bacterium]|nr:hypothetical protein [Patescibacteria group bacterium]